MKVGDKVIWKKDDKMYSAKKGATAVIYDIDEDKNIIRIKWDRDNPLHNGQSDGGYYNDSFKLLYPDKQECLFKNGDKVLVRMSDGLTWNKMLFVGMNPNKDSECKYIVIEEGGDIDCFAYKYCKLAPTYSEKQIEFFKRALEQNGYTVTE